MKNLKLTSLGQIPEADISFGDLTVFVGEQASGKSILLQLEELYQVSKGVNTFRYWRKMVSVDQTLC